MQSRIYLVLVAVAISALVIFTTNRVPSTSAQAPTTYGTLDNFDVINDTGGETHGFEIELEGVSSTDVAYTFGAPYQRYGDPTIVPTSNGVIIRYKANYTGNQWVSPVAGAPGGTPYTTAPHLPTQGHSCWVYGVQDPNQYYSDGCDHFGASLNAVPTKTTYRWLVEAAGAPGTLVAFGSNVPLPAPKWNITPPATPGPEPAVETVIVPQPPAPGAKWGEPMWVKVYVTELPNAVHAEDLDHMVIDDPNVQIVPNEPIEIEWEWMLLQASDTSTGEKVFSRAVPNGDESVSRRFEFYKYTGATDPDPENLGEALCDNPTAPDQQVPDRCGTPNADGVAGVGEFFGSQNAAVNLLGPVQVIHENHNPFAFDDTATVNEDATLIIVPATLLANDTDPDNDAISLHSVQDPVNGTLDWDGTNYTFTPNANYNGPASFTYTITDGYLTATATVNVTVNPVNDAPTANAGAAQTLKVRSIVALDGTGSSDIDVGDTLSYKWSFASTPLRSKAAFSDATATPTFKADKDGTYVVQLIVNDGKVDSAPSTVTVTVTKK